MICTLYFSKLKLQCHLFFHFRSFQNVDDLYNREFTGTAGMICQNYKYLSFSLLTSTTNGNWISIFLLENQRSKTQVTLQKEMYEIMR